MSSTLSADTGYWPARLEGAEPVELATDTPRLTAREYRRATVEQQVGAEAAATVGGGADGERVTAVLLTAFAAVLHRHTGVGEPVIGLALPDRTGGPLPVRVTVEPASTFAAALERTGQSTARDLEHAAHAPAAGPDGAGLVRVVLRVAGATPAEDAGPDLDLALEGDGPGAVLSLGYNTALFARATAAWLLRHVTALLAGAAGAPRAALRELRLTAQPAPPPPWGLPEPPDHRPAAPAGPGESLTDRLAAVAAEHPDRLALTGEGTGAALTYAELDRATTLLAHRLRRAAGPGDRVALLFEHGTDAVLAVWAALKCGASYVPLDPRLPDARLTRVLAEAGAAAVACSPGLAGRAQQLAKDGRVVRLGSADPSADAPPLPPVGGDRPAYLLFTSGSTGRPKGVEQTHRNVLAHALAYAGRVRLGPGDRVPLLARFTFDAAVMDLFGALLSGAALDVTDPLLTAPALRERLSGATVLHCTPTLLRHLVGDLPETGPPSGDLSGVRLVVLGGEEATRQDLRRFLAAFPPGSALVNGLGPTECTVALQHLAGRADLAGAVLPVGHPVDGVRVRLLDADGLPTEVYGELEIVSDRVAAGYWRQPEATSRAFGTCEDGTRYHRTGDLVRRRPDGSLVFEGRKDRQMKVRGHRLEPGEIEAALRAHPTVAQAALIADGRSGGDRLLAYVTPATPFPPDPAQLTRYLARILPDYAVPWRITALERLPVGPTGKLDRAALPLPQERAPAADEAPGTPAEQAVARIWCRVLGVTELGRNAHFMLSGGDSLRVLEMLAAVRGEFGVDVPLVAFLQDPTLAAVAREVARSAAPAGTAEPVGPAEPVEEEQPC